MPIYLTKDQLKVGHYYKWNASSKSINMFEPSKNILLVLDKDNYQVLEGYHRSNLNRGRLRLISPRLQFISVQYMNTALYKLLFKDNHES